MAVVFLIGGTGNQLFQYASCAPSDRISTFFLKPFIRNILKWTRHEQVIRYEKVSITLQIIALIILVFDVALSKLTGKCLFTTLDTRRIKSNSILFEFVRFGYFQQSSARRSIEKIAKQIGSNTQDGLIVLHIRGGDLKKDPSVGEDVYGSLDQDYYRGGFEEAVVKLRGKGYTNIQAIILTDDPAYASSFEFSFAGVPEIKIINCSLTETLRTAIGAGWFISSNSTMAYWIVHFRGGKNSIAPQPFQRRYEYDLPSATQRVKVDY